MFNTLSFRYFFSTDSLSVCTICSYSHRLNLHRCTYSRRLVYISYSFAQVVNSSGQVLYLHKMCPQARLLYLIQDTIALVRYSVQPLPSCEQIKHQFTTNQRNTFFYSKFRALWSLLGIEYKYLQFCGHS